MLVITRKVGQEIVVGGVRILLESILGTHIVVSVRGPADPSRKISLFPRKMVSLMPGFEIALTSHKNLTARIAVHAPRDVLVLRAELYDADPKLGARRCGRVVTE